MTADHRLSIHPAHDYDDPRSHLNALEMAAWAARAPKCPACASDWHLLPGPGTTWLIEWFHEPHCPEHEDQRPAAIRSPRNRHTG